MDTEAKQSTQSQDAEHPHTTPSVIDTPPTRHPNGQPQEGTNTSRNFGSSDRERLASSSSSHLEDIRQQIGELIGDVTNSGLQPMHAPSGSGADRYSPAEHSKADDAAAAKIKTEEDSPASLYSHHEIGPARSHGPHQMPPAIPPPPPAEQIRQPSPPPPPPQPLVCTNCGQDHRLRECCGPTDQYGYIGGCGKCNTMSHTLNKCPSKLTKNDIKHQIFRSRHNKAPAIWERDLKDPDYAGYLATYKPWTAEFSMNRSRQVGTGPWEKTGSISDPTWQQPMSRIPRQLYPGLERFVGRRHAEIFGRPIHPSESSRPTPQTATAPPRAPSHADSGLWPITRSPTPEVNERERMLLGVIASQESKAADLQRQLTAVRRELDEARRLVGRAVTQSGALCSRCGHECTTEYQHSTKRPRYESPEGRPRHRPRGSYVSAHGHLSPAHSPSASAWAPRGRAHDRHEPAPYSRPRS